jgi:hypothetical protein
MEGLIGRIQQSEASRQLQLLDSEDLLPQRQIVANAVTRLCT